jgi:hypothetical protein
MARAKRRKTQAPRSGARPGTGQALQFTAQAAHQDCTKEPGAASSHRQSGGPVSRQRMQTMYGKDGWTPLRRSYVAWRVRCPCQHFSGVHLAQLSVAQHAQHTLKTAIERSEMLRACACGSTSHRWASLGRLAGPRFEVSHEVDAVQWHDPLAFPKNSPPQSAQDHKQ